MLDSKCIEKLEYYKHNPREIDIYAEELVDVLCKYSTKNKANREMLLQHMKQTLSGCVVSYILYN